MPDYWVLDPIGHRRLENERRARLPDQEVVDHPIFGPDTVVIHEKSGLMLGDDWVCDAVCNQLMLTRFGADPWPIPVFGGYAVCPNCMSDWVDESGLPTTVCGCRACLEIFKLWQAMILRAVQL